MAIQLLQTTPVATTGAGSVANISVTFPNPITAGSLIVVWQTCQDSQVYCSDNLNNSGAQYLTLGVQGYKYTANTHNYKTYLFYWANSNAGTCTVSSNFSETSTTFGPNYGYKTLVAAEFSGVSVSPNITYAFADDQTAASNSVTTPSVATAVGNLLLSFLQTNGAASVTSPFTALTSPTNIIDSNAAWMVATSTTGSGTFNFSGGKSASINWQDITRETPALRQGVATNVSATKSVTYSAATTCLLGSCVVVAVCSYANNDTITLSDNLGNTYSSAITVSGNSNIATTTKLFYAAGCKAGNLTVTANWSVATSGEIHIAEFTGVDTLNPLDVTTSASGTAGTASASISPTTAGSLIYALCVNTGGSTAGSGYTGIASTNGDLAEYKVLVPSGLTSITFSETGYWVLAGMALKAATDKGLASTDVVGVVPLSNWNNFDLTTLDPNVTVTTNLKDSAGTATTASITFPATSFTRAIDHLSGPLSTPHTSLTAKMMFGYVFSQSSFSFTVNNLNNLDSSVTSWDVYLYFSSTTSNVAANAQLLNTSNFATYSSSWIKYGGGFTDSNTLSEPTHSSTQAGAAVGTYLHFTGITASSFIVEIDASSSSNFSNLAAMQIVPTGGTGGSGAKYSAQTFSLPPITLTHQTRTIPGTTRIKQVGIHKTLVGKARITVNVRRSQAGISRIKVNQKRTLAGIARLVGKPSPKLSGVMRIIASQRRSLTGTSRIKVTKTLNLGGIAKVYRRLNANQLGMARIKTSNRKNLAGVSRITVSNRRTIPGVSRIRVTYSRPLTGFSRLLAKRIIGISGYVRVRVSNVRTIAGVANIRVATNFAGAGTIERILALRPEKTISQLIEPQLPAFVRESYPQFITFLRNYFEWIEQNGTEVYSGKIIDSSQTSLTLGDDASQSTTEYLGKFAVILNGPAKGYNRPIVGYDPTGKVLTVTPGWDTFNVPPPNTLISIRDFVYPDRLLDYRDVDVTLEQFLPHFRNQFITHLPGSILANPRHILKHIKEFNQARGTEDAFRFLFRILFNSEIEFYYPKTDIFRPSAARWIKQQIMRTNLTNFSNWASRRITGVISGATAVVEGVNQILLNGSVATELVLSHVKGQFSNDPTTGLPEAVSISYPFLPPNQTELGSLTDLLEPSTVIEQAAPYQILSGLQIVSAGVDYQVGEFITIAVSGGATAKAHVSDVFSTQYNGRVNAGATGLTTFQIALASQESAVDGFFVGSELTITAGTGVGQRGVVIAYNGTTKVVTLDTQFSTRPTISTEYTAVRNKGGIKAVEITDVGLGVTSNNTTVSIATASGSGAVLLPVPGMLGEQPGFWTSVYAGSIAGLTASPDSFVSSNKVIQDSRYYQEFSYEIRFTQPIDTYRDPVNEILHPAGLKLFGAVSADSRPINARTLSLRTQETISHNVVAGNKFTTSANTQVYRNGTLLPSLNFAGASSATFNGTNQTMNILAADQFTSNGSAALNEGHPHGVPSNYGFYTSAYISNGDDNNPTVDHPGSTGGTAYVLWGDIYIDANGNPATNTRVAVRNLRTYLLQKSTNTWLPYGPFTQNAGPYNQLNSLDGADYPEDFNGASVAGSMRQEADGSLSFKPASGKVAHFYAPYPRIDMVGGDVGGLITYCEMRLIVDNVAGTDDRAIAKYLANVGADYYTANTGSGLYNNPGIGGGKFKYVGLNWRAFGFTTLTEAQLTQNPPPLLIASSIVP